MFSFSHFLIFSQPSSFWFLIKISFLSESSASSQLILSLWTFLNEIFLFLLIFSFHPFKIFNALSASPPIQTLFLNSSQKNEDKKFFEKSSWGAFELWKRKQRSWFIDPNEMFIFNGGLLKLITVFFSKIQKIYFGKIVLNFLIACA